MTNRINALTVVLEESVREDDAQAIINAILMIRGVLDVVPQVEDVSQLIANSKAKSEIARQLWEVLQKR